MTDLRHGHCTVALVISKLGLLAGCDGERRVLQVRIRHADGVAEDLLKPLVDVGHALAAVAGVLSYTLESTMKKEKKTFPTRRRSLTHGIIEEGKKKDIKEKKNHITQPFKKKKSVNTS